MRKLVTIAGILVLLLTAAAWAQQGRRGSARERWDSDAIILRKGEITAIALPQATFKSEGKEYSVHLGPQWFWKQNDYELKKGEAELRGEVEKEDDGLHFYPYTITQGAARIELADDDGIPKWSAAGRAGRRSGMTAPGRHHGHHGCRNGRCCQ